MRGWPALVAVLLLVSGCRAGTAPQELQQLRARVSVLEAEAAHLRGQASILESERDQLSLQASALAADLAKAHAGQGSKALEVVAAGENLVVVPREVQPGEWLAIHVQNYPTRLLPLAGVALRLQGTAGPNLTHIRQLSAANVFLLPVPRTAQPGTYQVVLGEAGSMGPGVAVDDQVSIVVRSLP